MCVVFHLCLCVRVRYAAGLVLLFGMDLSFYVTIVHFLVIFFAV